MATSKDAKLKLMWTPYISKHFKMFAIFWLSKLTGAKGNGEFCLDAAAAKSWLDYLNEKYEDIVHWTQMSDDHNLEETI